MKKYIGIVMSAVMLCMVLSVDVRADEQLEQEQTIVTDQTNSEEEQEAEEPVEKAEEEIVQEEVVLEYQDSEDTVEYNESVSYRGHVESYGWMEEESDGGVGGTVGKSKRLEAIEIKTTNSDTDGGVRYRSHIETYGWQDWKENGSISGTTGEGKRLEAIQIELTGQLREKYDIYYRVHVEDYGWLMWAKNGEMAGTSGMAKRLEAIQIVMVKINGEEPGAIKGISPSALQAFYHSGTHTWDEGIVVKEASCSEEGRKIQTCTECNAKQTVAIPVLPHSWDEGVEIRPETEQTCGQMKYTCTICSEEMIENFGENIPVSVYYRGHVESYGWMAEESDGGVGGTVGKSKRLESIEIKTTNPDTDGGVRYRSHVETYGWQEWKENGSTSGTTGEGKRLEAIQIELTGQLREKYDIYYRVHVEDYGWLMWAKNGEMAGTSGMAKRLEAIQIVMVKINGEEPGAIKGISPSALQAFYHSGTHTWDEGIVVKEASCSEEGRKIQTCTECNAKQTVAIPVLPHSWDEGVEIRPETEQTCGQMKYTCTICSEEMIKNFGENIPVSIYYRAHVESYGWKDYVSDGATGGSVGSEKRLEAIRIKVKSDADLGISYRTHCETYGWGNWVYDDETAGTVGLGKRLEMIQIKLTGADKDKYDVYYRVHVQTVGWLGWAKNGEIAGNAYAYRVEAIQIMVKLKSESGQVVTGGINGPFLGDAQTNFLKRVGKDAASQNMHGSRAGWCQHWVEQVYYTYGCPVKLACCASWAGKAYIRSTRKDNIPVGACVYSFKSRSGTWCYCGRDAGHVGIYIGNGYVAHNIGYIKIEPLLSWEKTWPYAGWGYFNNYIGK